MNRTKHTGTIASPIHYGKTTAGVDVANFRLEVKREYVDYHTQQIHQGKESFPIVAWGSQVTTLRNAGEGVTLTVEGELRSKYFAPKDTKKGIYRLEIHANEIRLIDTSDTSTNDK